MTPTERHQKIELLGNAYKLLTEALQQFPQPMWQFKPAPADWSIHEILLHIADSEANAYVRCRRFLAEPGQTLMAYNQDVWVTALRYHDQNATEALELFKWLRQNTYNLIKSLPEVAWSNTAHHPEYGMMTLNDWLKIYAQHIPAHIEQMKSNYQLWLKQTGVR